MLKQKKRSIYGNIVLYGAAAVVFATGCATGELRAQRPFKQMRNLVVGKSASTLSDTSALPPVPAMPQVSTISAPSSVSSNGGALGTGSAGMDGLVQPKPIPLPVPNQALESVQPKTSSSAAPTKIASLLSLGKSMRLNAVSSVSEPSSNDMGSLVSNPMASKASSFPETKGTFIPSGTTGTATFQSTPVSVSTPSLSATDAKSNKVSKNSRQLKVSSTAESKSSKVKSSKKRGSQGSSVVTPGSIETALEELSTSSAKEGSNKTSGFDVDDETLDDSFIRDTVKPTKDRASAATNATTAKKNKKHSTIKSVQWQTVKNAVSVSQDPKAVTKLNEETPGEDEDFDDDDELAENDVLITEDEDNSDDSLVSSDKVVTTESTLATAIAPGEAGLPYVPGWNNASVPLETLEQAWAYALEASRTLNAKDYERMQADANIRAARGGALPKISNVTGVHAISEELAVEANIPLSNLLKNLPDMTLETPISDKDFATSVTALTVPIYMGGRVRGMIAAAQAASNAIACGKQITQQDLKSEVAETYFLVLRVRHLRDVAVEAEATIAEHEKDAQRLFDNGIVTRNVVLAAQVAHANARQDVIKAENAVSLSQAAYNRLLWRQLDSPVLIADVEIPPLSGNLQALTSQAVSRRPELAALAYKSQALVAQAKVKRADRLPQVTAVGAHNYIENSHLNENSTFSGSLGVAWTPFDGGVSRNQQAASKFEALSVAREHEDIQSKIQLQVYQCWQDEQETRNRVQVAQKAVEQADENLRVVTRGFNEGLVNHTEVLDAQTLRSKAHSNLANARYDAILATCHLRRAVGTL